MIKLKSIAILVPVFATVIYFMRQYFAGCVCEVDTNLTSKVVIITGSNTGIGKMNALDLVQRGARVILACRSEERGMGALREIKNITGATDAQIKFMKLDLSSLKSIRQFVTDFKKNENHLDILTNNAGVLWTPYTQTEEGFELQFGVNHLGHFLLTNLLLDMLKSSAPSRIINVSSGVHLTNTEINFEDLMGEKSYDRAFAYRQSKLANILFTKELARRLQGTGVTTYAVHPGIVKTEIGRYVDILNNPVVKKILHVLSWPFTKNAWEGAQTQICCAVDPALEKMTGKYYSDCCEKEPSLAAQDNVTAKKLWDVSVQLVGLKAEEIQV